MVNQARKPPPKGMEWFDTWVKRQILLEPYRVWTGQTFMVGSKTGAKFLKRAYRHVIAAFKDGFSWRGKFSYWDLLVSTDGFLEFQINVSPVPSEGMQYLFMDFHSLNIAILKHYEHNSCPALYIPHLRYFTTNPPHSIWLDALCCERYLEFLRYQFAFADPNARGLLTDGLATAATLMGFLDRAAYENIIYRAWFMIASGMNLPTWVSIGSLNPIYAAIISFNDYNRPGQLTAYPAALYAFTRHTDVHGGEKTLTELFPPQAPRQLNTWDTYQGQEESSNQYLGQDAWAALEAVRKQRTIQAEQAAKASQQGQQAPSVEQQGQQAPSLEEKGQKDPSGKQGQQAVRRIRLKGHYIQTMINPVELNLMLGHDFGNFIAQATALITIESDLGIFHGYVDEVYDVYKKSIDKE